jgi:hypothetical protein
VLGNNVYDEHSLLYNYVKLFWYQGGGIIVRYLLNNLQLVYPPISNQEGDWLWGDEEVREMVKSSKLYMIGHREELFFEDATFMPMANGLIAFKLKMGETVSPIIYYSLQTELSQFRNDNDEISIEVGPKLIRITLNGTDNVIKWFTPDIFLYLLSRNKISSVTYDKSFDFSPFRKFELYYVGISKSGDSFSRLFKQAHHGRLKILSNANVKNFGSRLTDELVIFLFDIDRTNFNVLSTVEEIERDLNYHSDEIAVVADAEKAFIKLLKTEYNSVMYENFPKSDDGLYKENLIRYGYSIQEDFTFYTDTIEFNGASNMFVPKDLIMIEGGEAKVIKLT